MVHLGYPANGLTRVGRLAHHRRISSIADADVGEARVSTVRDFHRQCEFVLLPNHTIASLIDGPSRHYVISSSQRGGT